MKQIITTKEAPAAIGSYSQAVKVGNTVYLSGQIPLDPKTMTIVDTSIKEQIIQVCNNLAAVAKAASGKLTDIVKLNVYLVDLNHFAILNQIMAQFFVEPYPARAVVQVVALPKNAPIEIDAVMVLEAA